jgi:hypothetical protein
VEIAALPHRKIKILPDQRHEIERAACAAARVAIGLAGADDLG